MTSSQLLPPGRNVPLSAQIATQLRGQIESGTWALGSKIPGEHELVESLGASRNTVREALRGLVHAGLLEARPGDGTYVSATSELEVALGRRAAAEGILQVYQAREALELYAAQLAAEHASTEQIQRMQDALDARDSAGSVDEAVQHDLDFHLELINACGNPLIEDLYLSLDRFDTVSVPQSDPEEDSVQLFTQSWQVADPHRSLLDSIRHRDPEDASQAVRQLIAHSRRLFLETHQH